CDSIGGEWLFDERAIPPQDLKYNKDAYEVVGFVNFCCGDDDPYDNGALTFGNLDYEKVENHLICVYIGNRWQWIDTNEAWFAIKEINKPEINKLDIPEKQEKIISYDMVNNKSQWRECNKSNIGPIIPSLAVRAYGRFYCYKEENDFRYAICRGNWEEFGDDDRNIQSKNEITKSGALREVGSALTNIFNSKKIFDQTTIDEYGTIELVPYDAQTGIGVDNPINDWTGYKSLEFFIKINDTTIPLYLRIVAGVPDKIIFYEPVIDYVVNTPKNDEWLHVVIPIEDWINVKIIEFDEEITYLIPDYEVEIGYIFLRPDNEINLAYCSDLAFNPPEFYNKWISDLDNDSAACNASNPLYKWTGTKCCGDDGNSTIREYYNDTESGCWNSDVINDDTAIMNVEYNIAKKAEEKYEQIYPDIDVSFNVNTIGPLLIDHDHRTGVGSDEPNEGFACPAGFAVCGAKNKHDSRSQLSMISCCPVFGARILASGLKEISESREGKDEYCGGNKVVVAARNRGDDDYLKSFFCVEIEGVTIGTRIRFDNHHKGGWDWCPEKDQLVCGLRSAQGNEIDEFYCCKIDPIEDSRFTNIKGEQLSLYKSITYTSTISADKIQTLEIPDDLKNLFRTDSFVISDLSANPKVAFDVFFSDTGTTQTKNPDAIIVVKTDYSDKGVVDLGSVTATKTHSCNSTSCIYPLLGERPITVENLHPSEYNLFIVESDGNKEPANPTATTNDEESYILVENIKQGVLFYEGGFYGCNAPTYITDTYANIEQLSHCDVKGSYFCSYGKGWSDGGLDANQRNATRQIPDSLDPKFAANLQFEECCQMNDCWNGSSCVTDMSATNEVAIINGTSYRCEKGEWELATIKYTWDNSQTGFCPSITQCLVDPDGNGANDNDPSRYSNSPTYTDNPRCINDTQFIEDHYCEDGNWTSRTKLLATQLLHIEAVEDSFTLYCDYYSKILPPGTETRDALIEGLSYQEGLVRACFDNFGEANNYEMPCTNNFCSLSYVTSGGQPNMAIATSVNKPIDFSLQIGIPKYFLEQVFGIADPTYCNSLFNLGWNFTECDDTDDIEFWYSDRFNSVIYAFMPLQGMTPLTIWDRIVNFFRNIFTIFDGWKPTSPIAGAINISIVNETADYNSLCIAKRGDKEAYLIMEAPKISRIFLTASYQNLVGTDVCAAVEILGSQENFAGNIFYDCTKVGDNYVVYAEAPIDEITEEAPLLFYALWDNLVG
ncbi:hypothetical protein KY342_01180, partial [Candidatus Woesearchaeota archaeon]|nr:hypothetical protein [Candidatus Woesearchaeota archaeon]